MFSLLNGNIISIAITVILGFVAIIFYAQELKLRNRLMEKQFRADEDERKLKNEWFKNQELRIGTLSDHIADNLKIRLSRDINWAVQALEMAKIKPRTQSVFAERVGHFHEEKEHISNIFVPLLFQRCKHLITNENKHVFIVIDSGTTLHPIFGQIGQLAVHCRENNETWINKLEIITNNLPGIDNLMESGRINPNSRYSALAINCHLLPGVPLPIYSAITGKETELALRELKSRHVDDNSHFIGLMTGNWVRIRRKEPCCPIPLARGEGHLDFKQVIIDEMDEIYVIAPLGKIISTVEPGELNTALQYSDSNRLEENKPYLEPRVIDEKAKIIKLVTTSRSNLNYVLHGSSMYLMNHLDGISDTIKVTADSPHNLMIPFTKLPDDWHEQVEIEFPHGPTKDPGIMKNFFQVYQ